MADALGDSGTSDPYEKLRPPSPTPDDEVCHCVALRHITLSDRLGECPLYCLDCNGEVAPERIGFDEAFAYQLAHWRNLFRALYHLWLDSAEYEDWAAARLVDANGGVNIAGRECVLQLNEKVRTYYWWFVNHSVDDFIAPTDCPTCGRPLESFDNSNGLVCEDCSVLLV
jgi:hypothetical protein